MDINHQSVSRVLRQLEGKNIVSIHEKLNFTINLDDQNHLIRFFLDSPNIRNISYDGFIRLCEKIIELRSFGLDDLNLDVTDFELTAAYHFLSALDQNSVKNYRKDSRNPEKITPPTFNPSSIAPGLSKVKTLDRKHNTADWAEKAPPGIQINRGSDDVSGEPVLAEYEVLVNFITNRKKSADEETLYGGDSDDSIHYGTTVIRVPPTHKSGRVEKPKLWKLQLSENPDKHFTVSSIQEEDETTFFAGVKKQTEGVDQAIVFVHGFNVSFRNAIYKAAQLKFDLAFAGPMVLFSWPSKGKMTAYTHDITNAEYSSGKLSSTLEKLSLLGIKEIFLIGHSMGTRCLTMALKDLAGRTKPSILAESLVLAAPDIDRRHFEENLAGSISTLIKSGVIYASENDKALFASKLVNGYRRLGDVDENIPVFDKIDTIDASGKGTDILKHSYITEDNRVIDDLYHFLFNKTPPAKRRLRDSRNLKDRIYWKFI